MKYEKIVGLLSMAQRANKVASGERAILSAVQEHRVKLLLIAADAAVETRAAYEKLAAQNKIAVRCVMDRESLGQCLGKSFRAAAAVLDSGFSKALEERIIEAEKI